MCALFMKTHENFYKKFHCYSKKKCCPSLRFCDL